MEQSSEQIGLISAALKMAIDSHLEADPTKVLENPRGALDGYIEILKAARQMLSSGSLSWQKAIGGELVRAGELASYIDQEFPWLIEPLLCRGFLTQIQGAPKGGKSAFSLYLSLLAAIGGWAAIPELSRTQPATPLRVLYVAWEDPKIMMAKRLSIFGSGLGHARTFLPENLTFLFAPTFFANRNDHVAALSEVITDTKADIVVIDTLSYAHECEENAADQMRIPMGNLTRMAGDMNVSILYVHHTAKGSKDKSTWERGRGSAAIAAAWHILIDWGQREDGSDANPVTITSKLGVDASWLVHYNKEFGDPLKPKKVTSVSWDIESTERETSTTFKKKTERDGEGRVLEALQALVIAAPNKFVPGRDIVEAMGHQGFGKSVVYKYLGNLEKTFQAVRKTEGKTTFYGLTNI